MTIDDVTSNDGATYYYGNDAFEFDVEVVGSICYDMEGICVSYII